MPSESPSSKKEAQSEVVKEAQNEVVEDSLERTRRMQERRERYSLTEEERRERYSLTEEERRDFADWWEGGGKKSVAGEVYAWGGRLEKEEKIELVQEVGVELGRYFYRSLAPVQREARRAYARKVARQRTQAANQRKEQEKQQAERYAAEQRHLGRYAFASVEADGEGIREGDLWDAITEQLQAQEILWQAFLTHDSPEEVCLWYLNHIRKVKLERMERVFGVSLKTLSGRNQRFQARSLIPYLSGILEGRWVDQLAEMARMRGWLEEGEDISVQIGAYLMRPEGQELLCRLRGTQRSKEPNEEVSKKKDKQATKKKQAFRRTMGTLVWMARYVAPCATWQEIAEMFVASEDDADIAEAIKSLQMRAEAVLPTILFEYVMERLGK